SVRLHLVEASGPARAAQGAALGGAADRLVWSQGAMPASFDGALIANELLDALPVHQVVMRQDGLKEVYVSRQSQVASEVGRPVHGRHPRGNAESVVLQLREGTPSTPALQEYLDRAAVVLEPGWRAEINLRAVEWVRDAARRLGRGFMILIDYGHEARELYSPTHSAGTLTSFSGHRSAG